MTHSDRWNVRLPVVRYRQFADKLRLLWGDRVVSDRLDLTFVLPMPRSWSKGKKIAMDGKPHQQKPDVDNLCKAYLDSLLDDDSRVWDVRSRKLWGVEGRIVIRKVSDYIG